MKLCYKSFISGIIFATIGVSTVFAAGAIKSAQYNDNKVFLDGKQIDLSDQPLISVVEEGGIGAANYMPLRSVLESMGYKVVWDSAASSVNIYTKGEVVNPTISSLEGEWVSDRDGTKTAMKFDKNSNIIWCVEEYSTGQIEYLSGNYSINGNLVSTSFNYSFDGTSKDLTGQEMDVTLQLELSPDGKTLFLDGNSQLIALKKGTFDFSKYAAAQTVDAAPSEGARPVTRELLIGDWIGKSDGDKIKYSFDNAGNAAVRLVNSKDEIVVTMHGAYEVDGGNVLLTYDYFAMDDMATTLTGHDVMKETMPVTFSEDASTWTMRDSAVSISFARDIEVNDWRKYAEQREPIRPTVSLLSGTWSGEYSGDSIFYHFTGDGKFYCLDSLATGKKIFSSGKYSVLGNKLTLITNYENLGENGRNIANPITSTSTVNFSQDGNSWTFVDTLPITFKKSTQDDWVDEYSK